MNNAEIIRQYRIDLHAGFVVLRLEEAIGGAKNDLTIAETILSSDPNNPAKRTKVDMLKDRISVLEGILGEKP